MTPIKPRGVVPYLSHMYRHVLPQGVWFLRRFGLKKSIKFPLLVRNRVRFSKKTTGVYERTCRFTDSK